MAVAKVLMYDAGALGLPEMLTGAHLIFSVGLDTENLQVKGVLPGSGTRETMIAAAVSLISAQSRFQQHDASYPEV